MKPQAKILILLVSVLGCKNTFCGKVAVKIDTSGAQRIHTVNERFLSFTIDSQNLADHWKNADLTNSRLRTLTKYMQPAFLRIGGNKANVLMFHPGRDSKLNNQTNHNTIPNRIRDRNSTVDFDAIYASDILLLHEFAVDTNLRVIYDLNVLSRKNDQWDSSNARKLLNFMVQYNVSVYGWELGNEPNTFQSAFNTTVSPEDLARDFKILKSVLSRFPQYNDSLIIGPDVTNPVLPDSAEDQFVRQDSLEYLKRFSDSVGKNILSCVTVHHYFVDGPNSKIQDYKNMTILDTFPLQMNLAQKVIQKYLPGTPLWLGETSTGWGGGTPRVSDRFIAIFPWVIKLGQAAVAKIDVVMKQTLIGRGHYSFVDSDYNPTPTYYASLIYKQLVGVHVIGNITFQWKSKRGKKHMRLFVHCANSKLMLPKGAIVVYGVNTSHKNHTVKIMGKAGQAIDEYVLESWTGHLRSKFVSLNKQLLTLQDGHFRPDPFRPVERKRSFIFPSYSIGFWILKNARLHSVCNS